MPYHKGRVVGTFDVHVLSGGRMRVEVAARFSGKEYFGAAWLAEHGTSVDERHTIYRSRCLSDASRPATAALTEAARVVALAWVADHPDAFREADLDAARRELATAERLADELRAAVADVERRIGAAKTAIRVLGGAP
jgi:hypothetical protein